MKKKIKMRFFCWFGSVLLCIAAFALLACSGENTTETQNTVHPFLRSTTFLADPAYRLAIRNSPTASCTETSCLFSGMTFDPSVGTSAEDPVASGNGAFNLQSSNPSGSEATGSAGDIFVNVGDTVLKSFSDDGLGWLKSLITSNSGVEGQLKQMNSNLLLIDTQMKTLQKTANQILSNQVGFIGETQKTELNNLSIKTDTNLMDQQAASGSGTFSAEYSSFITDITNSSSNPSDLNDTEIDFHTLCSNKSSDFQADYYHGFVTSTPSPSDSILWDAWTVMENLYASTDKSSDSYKLWDGYITGASTYLTQTLPTVTSTASENNNLVELYYCYGATIGANAMNAAAVLQQAYNVFAFTLQLASECESFRKKLAKKYAYPGTIYDGIDIANLKDATSLQTAVQQMGTNFQLGTQIPSQPKGTMQYSFGNNAKWYQQQIASPYGQGKIFPTLLNPAPIYLTAVTPASSSDPPTPFNPNDPGQASCQPLTYVRWLDGNQNMNYFAADCGTSGTAKVGTAKVYQLFVTNAPTGTSDAPALNNLSFLEDFGLTANIEGCVNAVTVGIDDVITVTSQSFLSSEAPWMYNYATIFLENNLYGFDYYNMVQTQVQGCGFGIDGAGQGLPAVSPGPFPLNTRYWFTIDPEYSVHTGEGEGTTAGYAYALTPNGHLFGLMLNLNVNQNHSDGSRVIGGTISYGATTPGTTESMNNGVLTYKDGTEVTVSGEDIGAIVGNNQTYGFPASLTKAPSVPAESYQYAEKD